MKIILSYFLLPILLVACLTFSSQLQAATVAVPVPASSSRSTATSGQIVASSPWDANFKISWNITQLGSLYHYVYTLSKTNNASLGQGVDAFLLEVSPVLTSSNLNTLFSSLNLFSAPTTYIGTTATGTTKSVYAINFDFSNNKKPIIDFTTSLAPMWGDFYTYGSSGAYAYNANLGNDPTNLTSNFSGWIPVPGIYGAPVPEPSTWLLLGSILFVVFVWKGRLLSKSSF